MSTSELRVAFASGDTSVLKRKTGAMRIIYVDESFECKKR